jgi:CheY-like chemotaxis protein
MANPIAGHSAARARAQRTVVVISRHPYRQQVIEALLEAGSYDMVLVTSLSHAYSQVKRVAPDLVVLCLEFDDPHACRVLSMLKLDSDTCGIPVVTCAKERDRSASTACSTFNDPAVPARLLATPMN